MDKTTQEQSGIKLKRSPELDLKFYGFTEADLDREYPINERKIAVFPLYFIKKIVLFSFF
jgi:hypothetical protein